MDRQETAATLGLLSAAWPTYELPDPTVRLWGQVLADIDPRDALATADRIVREDRYFPTVARFLEVCRGMEHARRNREASERGLPEHRPPFDALPFIEGARQVLLRGGLRAVETTRGDRDG